MQHGDRLAEERRARLAAELMLEQVQAELSAANAKIAATNRQLSDEIVVKREEVETVRTEAKTLRDENLTVRTDLERAESAIMLAERRLWDSLETIQDGFAVFDADRVMMAANRAYLAAFDGLEMVGPGIHYHEMLKLMCEEGLIDLESASPDDWRMMMAARWDAERIEPVTVKLWNGSFIKLIDRRTRDGDMVSLGLNITATIKREAELERARARAEAANRAKSAFLANMSHEIRTPMNGVIGMADMLTETNLDEEQKLFVETIRNSGEALLVIINDVLDYSKIEAKKLELHPAPFDLERCIHEVLMLLQPSAHDKGLQLAVDYDMFMPTEFVGDPGRVRQILTNLAGNAVKFTETGHVAIRVVGLPVDDGRAYRVHVTVEDTGIGIPRENVKSIFGEFSQVEDERNRRYDGTGLGLAITKRLVELMNGEIWVDSEVNVGSGFGFHITMPVAEGAASPPVTAPDWIERAIVVDEPQMTRAILTKQLAAMGLPTLSVKAGPELDALAPGAKDVLVLGDIATMEQIASRLPDRCRPQIVALLSAPIAGDGPDGIAAMIQKPAQRREIARVLAGLEARVVTEEPPVAPGADEVSTQGAPGGHALRNPAAPPLDVTPPPAERIPEQEPDPGGAASSGPEYEPLAIAAVDHAPSPVVPASPGPGAVEAAPPSPSTDDAVQTQLSVAAPELDGAMPADLTSVGSENMSLPETPAAPSGEACVPGPDAESGPVAAGRELSASSAAAEIGTSHRSDETQRNVSPARSDPHQSSRLANTLGAEGLGALPGEPGAGRGAALSAPPSVSNAATVTAAAGFVAETVPTELTSPPSPASKLPNSSAGVIDMPGIDIDQPPPTATFPLNQDTRPAAVMTPPSRPGPAAPEEGAAFQTIAATAPPEPNENPETPFPLPEPQMPAECDTPSTGQSPDPGVTEQPKPGIAPEPPAPTVPARRMRVLAAEDNKTNRLVFSKMVRSLDIDLVFAENGLEAVASFEDEPPDLIFTDISMPEMDGKEASRRIRQIEAERGLRPTPIVAITAHAMAGDAEEILAAGIDSYLTKPLKRAALFDAITSAVPPDVRHPLGAAESEGPSQPPGLSAAPEADDRQAHPSAPAITNFVAE